MKTYSMKTNDPQEFERKLQAAFPELAATENDPIIAMRGEDFARQEEKVSIMLGHLLDWIAFFENDFENDENQTYSRMASYLESIRTVANHNQNFIGPYRERMVRRVKERMSEVRI